MLEQVIACWTCTMTSLSLSSLLTMRAQFLRDVSLMIIYGALNVLGQLDMMSSESLMDRKNRS